MHKNVLRICSLLNWVECGEICISEMPNDVIVMVYDLKMLSLLRGGVEE